MSKMQVNSADRIIRAFDCRTSLAAPDDNPAGAPSIAAHTHTRARTHGEYETCDVFVSYGLFRSGVTRCVPLESYNTCLDRTHWSSR